MPQTFPERYPEMQQAYNQLNAAQKKVIDEFAALELTKVKDFKSEAVAKILAVYVIPTYANTLSKNKLKDKAKAVYLLAKNQLVNAKCTTNIPAKHIASQKFRDSDDMKTVWATKTDKDSGYMISRQTVEENVFGYKVDWRIRIADAARTRPVYAALNYSDHPYGGAGAYGSLNCVLKPELKMRSTFINDDTFAKAFGFQRGTKKEIQASRKKICTAAHLENLTANLNDNQLKALCEKAEGRYVYGIAAPNYVEAQVHGGIRWDRDIDEIKIDEELLEAERKTNTTATALEIRNWVIQFATKCKARAAFYKNFLETEVLYTPVQDI